MNTRLLHWSMLAFFAVFIVTIGGATIAHGFLESNVSDQIGADRMEEACNEEFGVEWEYRSIDRIDGEYVNPGVTDIPGIMQTNKPITENVTVECHLNQGFLASTDDRVTIEIDSENET